jgi:formylglycine-generating enzyme required for sulfatase activity
MKPTILICGVSIAALFLMAFKKDDANKVLPKTFREKLAFFDSKDFELDRTKVHTEAFYLSVTEVSNAEYREFLKDLAVAGNQNLFETCNIDSAGWRESLAYNEPYVEYYHKHPAYDNYPVVNVSYEGALEYCKWMEKRLNREAAETGVTYEVRLPSRAEWVRAANGRFDNSVYAWGGPALKNAKGCSLCNYMYLGDESVTLDKESGEYKVIKGLGYMGVAGFLKDNADITAPVYAYSPSDLGLYNMNGNVAEMVSERGVAVGGGWRSPGYDVRNESSITYNKPLPTVGFRPLVVKKEK